MEDDIRSVLEELEAFPLLGTKYSPEDYGQINMNLCTQYNLEHNAELKSCIEDQLRKENAKVGFGGYLENRTLYQRSAHFHKGQEARSIHLGLDLWAEVYTPIFAPINGKVHSFAYNDAPSDYGATIILEHEVNGERFYTLYGHLDYSDIQELTKGREIQAGEVFCHLGSEESNGGWVPHLHFQIILDMEGKEGDYPGVAAPSEVQHYQLNCPDPTLLFTK